MNLRPRNKGKVVAPGAALKNDPKLPTPTTSIGSAKPKRGKSKRTRQAENNGEEGPSRKKVKREDAPEVLLPPTPESQTAPLQGQSTHDAPLQQPPPVAGPSSLPPLSPYRAPSYIQEDVGMANPYDEDLYSGTESSIGQLSQHDYDTPVSSRAGTPYPSYIHDLERCTGIMEDISKEDVVIIQEIADARSGIDKSRQKARNIRLLTQAERGRRERMEAYFRYWQEIEPYWDKRWLYGERMVAEHLIRLEPLDEPLGPPTLLNVPPPPPPLAPAARPVPAPVPVTATAAAPVKQMEKMQAGPSNVKQGAIQPHELPGWTPLEPTDNGKAKAKATACEPFESSAPVKSTENADPSMEERDAAEVDELLGSIPCDSKGKGKANTTISRPSDSSTLVGDGSMELPDGMALGVVPRSPTRKNMTKRSRMSPSVPFTPAPNDTDSSSSPLSPGSIEPLRTPEPRSGDELPLLFAEGSRSSL